MDGKRHPGVWTGLVIVPLEVVARFSLVPLNDFADRRSRRFRNITRNVTANEYQIRLVGCTGHGCMQS